MSSVKIQGDASGSGQFTIASPNSNNTRTATLPDATGNIVVDSATQTLTNKTIQGGTITSVGAVSASGSTVTYGSIPSWVKRITVTIDGVSVSSASDPIIQIGDAGGLETTGYVSAIGSNSLTTGFVLLNTGAADAIRGVFVLVNSTGNTWVASYNITAGSTGSAGAGTKTLSDTLTQVALTIDGSGTFDAGTINVLYEG